MLTCAKLHNYIRGKTMVFFILQAEIITAYLFKSLFPFHSVSDATFWFFVLELTVFAAIVIRFMSVVLLQTSCSHRISTPSPLSESQFSCAATGERFDWCQNIRDMIFINSDKTLLTGVNLIISKQICKASVERWTFILYWLNIRGMDPFSRILFSTLLRPPSKSSS